jgi:hypothetical protein
MQYRKIFFLLWAVLAFALIVVIPPHPWPQNFYSMQQDVSGFLKGSEPTAPSRESQTEHSEDMRAGEVSLAPPTLRKSIENGTHLIAQTRKPLMQKIKEMMQKIKEISEQPLETDASNLLAWTRGALLSIDLERMRAFANGDVRLTRPMAIALSLSILIIGFSAMRICEMSCAALRRRKS